MNIRKKIVEDLELTMENIDEFGLPVEILGPAGTWQTLKKGTQDKLTGQVLYNFTEFNPDTGEEMVFDDPVLVLRLESLDNIPNQGESWLAKVPEKPDPEATLVEFAFNANKPMKFNRSIGFVRIYLSRIKQS